MQKEQKKTWRDQVRENGKPSWREQRVIWGLGFFGIISVCASICQLFQGRSITTRGAFLSPLWFFALGADAMAISVSTHQIYYRNLTDKGLFWAGVTLRVGYMLFGLIFLLDAPLDYPKDPLECAAICIIILVICFGIGGVSLVRLICAYRQENREEEIHRQTGREKNKDPWDRGKRP